MLHLSILFIESMIICTATNERAGKLNGEVIKLSHKRLSNQEPDQTIYEAVRLTVFTSIAFL